MQALGAVLSVGVDVADTGADLDQAFVVEGREADLDGAGAVEPRVCGERRVEPLGQRRQPLNALRPVVEGWGSGHHEVQPRKVAGIDLVEELS